MTTYKVRVIPGTARRWIKRNLWRLVLSLLLFVAGAVILRLVGQTRTESWALGGEIIPAAACWVLAARVAAGEQNPNRRS